ncbi:MAG TPA: nucleotide exchange factor GrpE [Vicinamibacteria bacterium]|nr:nucleotide exchange factor GrpE [Vicinamibacteria bacterium]
MPDEPEAGGDPVGKGSPETTEQTTEGGAKPELAAALEAPPGDSLAEAYHRRARLAEDRLAEVLAAYRKLKADNEAHRGRVTKNLERRFEQRIEKLLVAFIDILDNFDRALEATEQSYAGNPLIEGLILVRTQLLQTLQDQGLERIPALGLPFDPAHSEAVETRVVADPDHHHLVIKELLRGYKVHGRVVRPSRVVVGEYPGGALAAPQGGADVAHALEALAEPAPEAESAGQPGEPSLEDIVSRAEAQEALFPEAFDDEDEEPSKG